MLSLAPGLTPQLPDGTARRVTVQRGSVVARSALNPQEEQTGVQGCAPERFGHAHTTAATVLYSSPASCRLVHRHDSPAGPRTPARGAQPSSACSLRRDAVNRPDAAALAS